MTQLQKVVAKVLKEIKPTKEQEDILRALSADVINTANEVARPHRAFAILAGSLTRNTWLPSKKEFDVFIVFPETTPEAELKEKGLEIGKEIIEKLGGKWRVDYAQHPYITGTLKNFEIDIVPCYKVKTGEEIKSAVDRTPFHVEYLNKKFPREFSDQARVLKHFLKANGLYGADSKTEGFSGYMCELLVVEYGTFGNILEHVSRWEAGQIVDIEKFWHEKDYDKLRKKFKGQPLIFIDPVDKNRNTSAAVSSQTFFKFRKLAREFLKDVSEEFFQKRRPKPLTKYEMRKLTKGRGTELIILNFRPPKVVPDILWPQLKRFTKRMENIMNDHEFHVLRSDYWTDGFDIATVILELEVHELPLIDKKVGPSVFDKKGSESFIDKYQGNCVNGPFIEGNYWCVEVERKWHSAKQSLMDSLSDKLVDLKAKGVPKNIAEEIVNGFEILKGESIEGLLSYSRGFAGFLREYFEKENLA
jgi:tRNA nucleotidyltransferase (CCA-adding enzyme)